MINRIHDHIRGFIAGALDTAILGGFFLAPHATFHVSFGNQPEQIAQAEIDAKQIAAMMPVEAQKPGKKPVGGGK